VAGVARGIVLDLEPGWREGGGQLISQALGHLAHAASPYSRRVNS
jgi:hypothetical protein